MSWGGVRAHYSPLLGVAKIGYSTGIGKVCPGCGWPVHDCKCRSKSAADQAVPGRVTAKLRVEKTGRGGKVVTVVYDLPRNAPFLKGLTQELKRSCGTGGTATDDSIELQGDLRDRVRELLLKKGYLVKG